MNNYPDNINESNNDPRSPNYEESDGERDYRVADIKRSLLQDDDSVEEIIANNADVMWHMLKTVSSAQDIIESIEHWVECEAERIYDKNR